MLDQRIPQIQHFAANSSKLTAPLGLQLTSHSSDKLEDRLPHKLNLK